MSTIKQIFDALTGDSMDGCDPDWCREILAKASPEDRQRVEEAFEGHTEDEAAFNLGIMRGLLPNGRSFIEFSLKNAVEI